MATPNLDILHLRFANSIEDPVGSASSTGGQFTPTQRDGYINRGINDLCSYIYHMIGPQKSRIVLQSMETTQAITFSSSGVSVASDYVDMPTNLIKASSSSIFTHYPKKDELDNNVNPNISAAYTITGNKLYAYESGSILNSGTGTFYYIRQDAGVEGTTDINISPKFYDNVVDLAVIYALEETGDLASASARAGRMKILLDIIRKM